METNDLRMHRPNKTGVVTFFLGALIGMAYFLIVFIQDTEAIIFAALISGDRNLVTLSCPEIITRQDDSEITARISNRTEKALLRSVRAHITEGYLTLRREIVTHDTLEPGETLRLKFPIYPEDAAYGYLILAKVLTFRQVPYPSQVGACGVMFIDLPMVQGWHLIAVFWASSITLMAVGYSRYHRTNQPLVQMKHRIAMNLRVVFVLIVLAMGLMFLELFYLELVMFILLMVLLAESIFSIILA